MLRIWIELDRPESPEHAKELVTAANAMMAKLGCHDEVFAILDGKYIHQMPNGAGFYHMPDRGDWFSLEFLARSTADEA